jgi:hydrogenase/urease accessory protein HupE
MKKISMTFVGLAAMTGAADAHPGGHVMSVLGGVFHVFTEPDHLAWMLGAAALAVALFYVVKRRTV